MRCNVTKLPYIRITLMIVTVLLMYTLAQINVVNIHLNYYSHMAFIISTVKHLNFTSI